MQGRTREGAAGTTWVRYETVPRIVRFADVLDKDRYVVVPDGCWIAHCDIVASTAAIAEGRYRAVNLAGAAVIAAVRNALAGRDVPFVFGGDGASLLIEPDQRHPVEQALAATVTWVREALGLTLRAALIPVSAVHAAGHELRVARYAVSDAVDYAMFSGGGLAFADAATKQGLYAVVPAPAGVQPDLTGLSCRFAAVPNPGGIVLSLIVVPRPRADRAAVQTILAGVLAAVEASPAMGHPLPAAGPTMRPPWAGLDAEARVAGRLAGSLALRRLQRFAHHVLSFAIFRFGLTFGRFSAPAYRRQLAANADFRKYDDGLRLTAACPASTADAIEAGLVAARADGLVDFGLHRQDCAVVTCISPSSTRDDHLHFVDGGGGGYALAAQALKRSVG